jgi:hypothetical protein
MRTLLSLAAAAAILTGCPKRIEFGPEGPIDDPEVLLRLIDEAESRVLTLSGDSKVRADTPQAKGAFSMFVALARPALIHLEPMDFFGKPQAVLGVNGERFGLYSAQENKFFRGPASPENVSRFLPIVLPAPELTQIMLGVAPRIPHQAASVRVDEKCGCYELTLTSGTLAQALKVHTRHYRVLESRISGAPSYELAFDDLADYGKIAFPRRLVLRAEEAKVHVDLRYTQIKLNESPDPTLFDLEPPEGVPVVEVDAQGRPRDSSAEPVPNSGERTASP